MAWLGELVAVCRQACFTVRSDGAEFLMVLCQISSLHRPSSHDEGHRLPGKTRTARTAFKQAALCSILEQAEASAAARGQQCTVVAMGDMSLARENLVAAVQNIWPDMDVVTPVGSARDPFAVSCNLSADVAMPPVVASDKLHQAVSVRVKAKSVTVRPPAPAALAHDMPEEPGVGEEPPSDSKRARLAEVAENHGPSAPAATRGQAQDQGGQPAGPCLVPAPATPETAAPPVVLDPDAWREVARELQAREVATRLHAQFLSDSRSRAATRQQAVEEAELEVGGAVWCGWESSEAHDDQAAQRSEADHAVETAGGDESDADVAKDDDEGSGRQAGETDTIATEGVALGRMMHRRSGARCRAIVRGEGGVDQLSSAQETIEHLTRLIFHRLAAIEKYGSMTSGVLGEEPQLWALDCYEREWRNEPFVKELQEKVWQRHPTMDLFRRTMRSHFKTALFDRRIAASARQCSVKLRAWPPDPQGSQSRASPEFDRMGQPRATLSTRVARVQPAWPGLAATFGPSSSWPWGSCRPGWSISSRR